MYFHRMSRLIINVATPIPTNSKYLLASIGESRHFKHLNLIAKTSYFQLIASVFASSYPFSWRAVLDAAYRGTRRDFQP